VDSKGQLLLSSSEGLKQMQIFKASSLNPANKPQKTSTEVPVYKTVKSKTTRIKASSRKANGILGLSMREGQKFSFKVSSSIYLESFKDSTENGNNSSQQSESKAAQDCSGKTQPFSGIIEVDLNEESS
jgi:hypothetical protein